MLSRVQNRLETLTGLRCKARLKLLECPGTPREAKPVLEEGYLEADNLRRTLLSLREAHFSLQALWLRRAKYLEEWQSRVLPEPPEIPLNLLKDSRLDLEASMTSLDQQETRVSELFSRYRFPRGRPLPVTALGKYSDGEITLYMPVLWKVSQLLSVSPDRFCQVALVYFALQGILQLGLDGDQGVWATYSQADPQLLDALSSFYTVLYGEKYDHTLLPIFNLWQQFRQEGNPGWQQLQAFRREQVRSALILIRSEPDPTWVLFQEFLNRVAQLG
ncbi:MAG TPA: hypothetical protein VHS59_03370 [Bacillota bacterium]|nr:hypothetical protein [Bacillota bacterium]